MESVEVVIDWLNSNPGVVSAAVALGTGLLALGTFWVGWQAKEQAEASGKMAKEMERQRLEGRVSELTLWSVPDRVNIDGVRVNIQNCGRGPAREILVECWWRKDPETFYYLYDGPSSLNPGDTRYFDCRRIPQHLPTSPGVGDFVARIVWRGFDGAQYGPRLETVMNNQMRAFGTNFSV